MEQQSITKQISKPNVVSRYSDGSYEKNCRDDINYDEVLINALVLVE
jgi:hypothetical protein